MKRKHKVTGMLMGAVGCVMFAGLVLAAWSVTGRAVNSLSTASFSNRIVEEYQMPQHVNPGQSVSKIVRVKNQGTADSLVRIKVTAALGKRDGKGKLIKDESLDSQMVQVEYNTKGWKQMPDGYWYYKRILKAGTTTEEPLMKSYRLSEKADNRYKNKDGEILVEMESIQAAGNALKELWGIREKELGIKTSGSRKYETVTRVTFDSNQSIDINAADTDLFANFKNLLPGCSGTQKIKVSNKSAGKVELFLRAEAAKQGRMSEKQKKLVKKLLSHYVSIEVKMGKKVLYEGSADGNLKGKGNTMKKDISLGIFEPGASENLIVTLSVSPEMGNAFQKLTGKVDWVFTAVGESTTDGGSGTGNTRRSGTAYRKTASAGRISPKTGDTQKIALELVFAAGSLMLLVISGRLLWIRKRDGQK